MRLHLVSREVKRSVRTGHGPVRLVGLLYLLLYADLGGRDRPSFPRHLSLRRRPGVLPERESAPQSARELLLEVSLRR
jgi:hypothetical protein